MAKDWRWAWLPFLKNVHWILRDWLPIDTTSWSRAKSALGNFCGLLLHFKTLKSFLAKSHGAPCAQGLFLGIPKKTHNFAGLIKRAALFHALIDGFWSDIQGQPWWKKKLDQIPTSHATHLVLSEHSEKQHGKKIPCVPWSRLSLYWGWSSHL